MDWARRQCFRDPTPVSRDYFLCSHAAEDRFGLYVIDRYGNRELLHFDPQIGSMCPTLLRPQATPPVLTLAAGGDGSIFAARKPEQSPECVDSRCAEGDSPIFAARKLGHSSGRADLRGAEGDSPIFAARKLGQSPRKLGQSPSGQFFVADVYRGLQPAVPRGAVKYLRVCGEVRSDLRRLPDGRYQADHEPFQDWYATPVHKVSGPHGWPSYVAKESFGLATVEEDGSAHFYAPAGKVLYFEALDENFNELQRMRSVVQLQPGERRSCVGCHEDRSSAPPVRRAVALRREPQRLQPPPWGAGPFSYEQVVQPVWDARCVSCHDAQDEHAINLAGTLNADRVPASYGTLIAQGWVHYFDCRYTVEHAKAGPGTFGTLRSKLWEVLDGGHHDVKLSTEDARRVKCWIDLNCPLWPDYQFRGDRPLVRIVQKRS